MPNGSSAAGFQGPAEFLDSAAKKPAQGMRLAGNTTIAFDFSGQGHAIQ
ncbi:MAG TPA: hypothetical protein VII48_07455 [Rhizomicrobium sp.]